jgi:hypothetical protein
MSIEVKLVSGHIITLMRYKRKVEAVEEILPKLCPNCRKLVEDALG